MEYAFSVCMVRLHIKAHYSTVMAYTYNIHTYICTATLCVYCMCLRGFTSIVTEASSYLSPGIQDVSVAMHILSVHNENKEVLLSL